MRDGNDQQRVAVRRGSRGGFRAEHAAGAAAIVDVDFVAELLGKLVRDEASDHVIAAARRERNDQPHRPVRILGRRRRGKGQQQYERERAHHFVARSSTSIDTPSGPRTKQILMPGRGEFSSMVNSAPLALRSATTLSMFVTRRPKWSSP